jgi:hypothetical protein
VGAHLNRGFLSPHSGALAQRVLASARCLRSLSKSFLHRSWRFFTGKIPSRAVSIPKHLRVNLPPIVRGASAASQSRCLVAPFPPKAGIYRARGSIRRAVYLCGAAVTVQKGSAATAAWHATLTSRTSSTREEKQRDNAPSLNHITHNRTTHTPPPLTPRS